MDLLTNMMGEHGGTVSVAFGIGASAGYSFALKTALTEARDRIREKDAAISDKDKRIAQQENEIRELLRTTRS